MNYYKSCKTKHNISLDWDKLRLGTFQDYREMDPSFSIADNQEGFTEIEIHANELMITTEQWNDTIGNTGVLSIGKKMRSELVKTVKFNDQGSSIAYNENYLTINGKLTVSLSCPNVYMFCVSTTSVSPETISGDYDSQYYFTEETIGQFIQIISKLIIKQFQTKQIDEGFNGELAKPELFCRPIFRLVDYTDDKKLILRDNKEFTINLLEETILKGMFEKDKNKYSSDAEYRILFPIYHKEHGIIPVKKDAMFIELSESVKDLVSNSKFE